MTAAVSGIVTPVGSEVAEAAEVLSFMDGYEMRNQSSVPAIYRLSGANEHDSIELTEQLHDALKKVVQALSRGQSVSIVARDQEVTTQQAAEILGLSRPTVVKLVDDGEIPAQVPGKVRRKLRLTDVLAYQESLRERRSGFIADFSDAYNDDDLSPAELDEILEASRTPS